MNNILNEKMHKSGYLVRYREKCYTCGSICNIYLHEDKWQCKKCWDYEDKLKGGIKWISTH